MRDRAPPPAPCESRDQGDALQLIVVRGDDTDPRGRRSRLGRWRRRQRCSDAAGGSGSCGQRCARIPRGCAPSIVMKLTHRLRPAGTHPMQAMVLDEPQRSRAERVSVPAHANWAGLVGWMEKHHEQGQRHLEARPRCPRSLRARGCRVVTGGVGEVFLAAVLPTVDGHTDATWVPRTYAVDPDLSGAVTGARAGLYERRKI